MALVTQTKYGEYTYMGINLQKGVPAEVTNKSALEYFKTLEGFTVEEKAGGNEPPATEPPATETEAPADKPKEAKGGKKPPLKS